MKRIWHPELKDRWPSFPKHQQLLMAANEVNRAHNMQSNLQEYRNALESALELMDFIAADPRWRRQLSELRRAREVTAMYYIADQPQSTKTLMNCFILLEPSAWRYLHGIQPLHPPAE